MSTVAKEEIIKNNLRLVSSAAKKTSANSFMDYEERFSIGCESLIEAINTYDPSRAALSTHFYNRFRANIANTNRKNKNPRNTVSMDAPIQADVAGETCTLHDIIASNETDILDQYIRKETIRDMWKAVSSLPADQRQILTLRYIKGGGNTQRRVAKILGLHLTALQRKEAKAIDTCRAVMDC